MQTWNHDAGAIIQNAAPAVGRGWIVSWSSPALLGPGALLSAATSLGLPLLLHLAGLSSLNRLAYPAMAFLVAGFLYMKRSPWYFGFCVWLFCACSLVRRLADYQAGFQVSSTILVAPYIACMLAGASAIRYLGTGKNLGSVPFFVVLSTIFYGTVLAVLQDRLTLGLVDMLKWTAGPLIAVHALLYSRESLSDLRQVVSTALLVAAPMMAVYGVLQFASPFPWDAEWVINVRQLGFDSIGVPEPFGLRVFGPMHSPGALATYLMVGIMLSVGQRALPSWLSVAVCTLCLALCMYRTLWAATCLGLLLVFFWGSPGAKVKIVIGAAIVVMGTSMLALVPEVQFMLAKRFATLSDLQTDESGAERLMQYVRFFVDGGDHMLGVGLGVNYQASVGGQGAAFLDSGILDTIRALGLFGGLLYLAGLAALILTMLSRRFTPGLGSVIFRSAAVVCFLQIPLGSVHVAEAGFLGWLTLAVGLASGRPRSLASISSGVLRNPSMRNAT
jgi:hypothetical protein